MNAYSWSRDQLAMLSLYPNYSGSFEGWRRGRSYRALLNQTLGYLVIAHSQKTALQYKQSAQIVFEQYQLARNMTEMMGALTALVHSQRTDIEAEREEILDHFYRHFKDDRFGERERERVCGTLCGVKMLKLKILRKC